MELKEAGLEKEVQLGTFCNEGIRERGSPVLTGFPFLSLSQLPLLP